MLYAALYNFGQSFCALQAVFRRHAMDPRGRIAVSLPGDFDFPDSETSGSVWDAINQKVWHSTTRKELTVLLEALEKADHESRMLILWEGTDYKPPVIHEFWRTYKKSATGALDALDEIRTYFAKTPVATIIPIVGPAFGDGGGAKWEKKLVDKVSALNGKMEV